MYCHFSGAIHVYLTKLPVLGDSHLTRLAYLTSLREVLCILPSVYIALYSLAGKIALAWIYSKSLQSSLPAITIMCFMQLNYDIFVTIFLHILQPFNVKVFSYQYKFLQPKLGPLLMVIYFNDIVFLRLGHDRRQCKPGWL